MYAALRLMGNDNVSLDELISSSYIATYQGSTAANLIDMAGHYNVPAVGFTSWRLNQICSKRYPVILEVRPSLQSREYNHWVMVYAVDNDTFVMVDPPFEPRVVSGREIASRWRGRGVLVGTERQAATLSSALRGFASIPVLVLLTIVPGIFGVTKLGILKSNQSVVPATCTANRAAMKQGIILVILACITGFVYHITDDFGLLRNYNASVGIQRANASIFLERVGYQNINNEMLRGAILIDARRQSDYTMGHLPGAINIPLGIGDEQRRSITDAWPKSSRIVVYCQSLGCDYDERIAALLSNDGYKNIAVYEGGWVEWQAQQNQQASISQ